MQQLYVIGEDGRVVSVFHRPETLDLDTLAKGILLDDADIPAAPQVEAGQRARLHVFDGVPEWRVEAHPPTREEILEETLRRVEEKLDRFLSLNASS